LFYCFGQKATAVVAGCRPDPSQPFRKIKKYQIKKKKSKTSGSQSRMGQKCEGEKKVVTICDQRRERVSTSTKGNRIRASDVSGMAKRQHQQGKF
jgi:hypothetical protein